MLVRGKKLCDDPLAGMPVAAKDWPWSSWSFYATGEVGLVPIDVVLS